MSLTWQQTWVARPSIPDKSCCHLPGSKLGLPAPWCQAEVVVTYLAGNLGCPPLGARHRLLSLTWKLTWVAHPSIPDRSCCHLPGSKLGLPALWCQTEVVVTYLAANLGCPPLDSRQKLLSLSWQQTWAPRPLVPGRSCCHLPGSKLGLPAAGSQTEVVATYLAAN